MFTYNNQTQGMILVSNYSNSKLQPGGYYIGNQPLCHLEADHSTTYLYIQAEVVTYHQPV